MPRPPNTSQQVRVDDTEDTMEEQDKQTRFAIIGGILASLIILSICMAFTVGV